MGYLPNPLCRETQQRQDTCFACVDGRCKILKDTNFLYKECPFYKTREELKSQRERIEEEFKKWLTK